MQILLNKIFTKKIVRAALRLLFFYALIKLIFKLVSFLMILGANSTLALEINANADLSFNDLHYSLQRLEQAHEEITDNLLIVNSGELNQGSFRLELARLISLLSDYPVNSIAVDVVFSADSTKIGTYELLDVVKNNPKVIMALDTTSNKKYLDFGANIKYGTINFPLSEHTIRRYYSTRGTFAARVASSMGFSLDTANYPKNNFVINYVQDTLYPYHTFPTECAWDTLFAHTKQGFKELPLMQIYSLDSTCLVKLLKNKTILIGHIKNSCTDNYYYDREDKFASSVDRNLLYRPETMPGILIHANAIQNIVNPQVRFYCWSDQFWFYCLEELLLLGYLIFLLFSRASKIVNILILFFLSIPTLYVALLAMKHHIYIELGMTLLQFLIFEELVEIVEPLYEKVKKAIVNKKFLNN